MSLLVGLVGTERAIEIGTFTGYSSICIARDAPVAPPGPSCRFAFIDADKTSYGAYFDDLVPRMRSGGLICVDNTLWSGRVVADGLTLARVR